MKSKVHDFIIIGGGPAGSTAATLLSRKGYDVVVLEKEKFPREHVGESLLPFSYHLFEDLGILDTIKANFIRKPGVQFLNIDGSSKSTYCFRHVIEDESHLSFHVPRAKFDDILLRHSEKHGAVVHEEHKVVEVNLALKDNLAEICTLDKQGKEHRFVARQVIDASGQFAVLAKHLGSKKPYDNLDRIAFFKHWHFDVLPEAHDEGVIQIVYLGEAKRGWFFLIPLDKHNISVGIVLDGQYTKAKQQELMAAGDKKWQETLYLQEIAASPHVQGMIDDKGATAMHQVMSNGDYSYYSDIRYGDNFTLIGDACAFLDPIFSSGIHIGMKSAFLVADALDEKMKHGDMKNNKSLEEVYEQIKGGYELVGKFVYYFYNADGYSLAEISDEKLRNHLAHETAFSMLHYLLSGDFFTEHKRYSEFIDFLQNPKNLKKFKALSLNSFNTKSADCSADKELVFKAFEDERNAVSFNFEEVRS
jgi:flavin-dependent dehydrogenase